MKNKRILSGSVCVKEPLMESTIIIQRGGKKV